VVILGPHSDKGVVVAGQGGGVAVATCVDLLVVVAGHSDRVVVAEIRIQRLVVVAGHDDSVVVPKPREDIVAGAGHGGGVVVAGRGRKVFVANHGGGVAVAEKSAGAGIGAD